MTCRVVYDGRRPDAVRRTVVDSHARQRVTRTRRRRRIIVPAAALVYPIGGRILAYQILGVQENRIERRLPGVRYAGGSSRGNDGIGPVIMAAAYRSSCVKGRNVVDLGHEREVQF